MRSCPTYIILHVFVARYHRALHSGWAIAVFCNAWLSYFAIYPSAQADVLPKLNLDHQNTQSGGLLLTDPGARCRAAVDAAGRQYGIPDHIMSAIARVESGRQMPDGRVTPWPWSINVAGEDHVFETREAAIASVRQFQASGVRSIDVGCMQVNLLHHPQAFGSLDQGFDPVANANYAAKFLHDLFVQTGSWAKAIANYHSATPELGEPYRRRVMLAFAQEVHAAPAWTQSHSANGTIAGSSAESGDLVATLTPPAGGGAMLGNHSETAKILPQANGVVGRGLDTYRARPVRVAGRPS